jgi:hypothetical protein
VLNAISQRQPGRNRKRFFIDERKTHKGIRLTTNFHQLTEGMQYQNLKLETDALEPGRAGLGDGRVAQPHRRGT